MIGTISIQINAANPNLPLKTLFAFVDSPSSLRIIDVPKKIGKWNITAVRVQATYPDNSIVSSSCVLTGGCWTCTIGGSTSVGKSLNGYAILADGTDENGQAVEGYVLGKGDVVIIDADVRTAVGDKMYYLHLLDDVPEDPKKGDVVQTGDNWLIYDGDAWTLLGGASWGNITGDLSAQQDLQEKFDIVDSVTNGLQLEINNHAEDIEGLQSSKLDIGAANQTFATKESIQPTAPSTEADENSLAGAKSTADFVNSSINAFAAFYLTKNASGDAFQTKYELDQATVFYNGGEARIPTKNDYLIVLEDETKTTALGVDPTTRYTYQGTYPDGQWEFQYVVNNTSLTQSQINAINSGITSQKVAKIDSIDNKRNLDDNVCHKNSYDRWIFSDGVDRILYFNRSVEEEWRTAWSTWEDWDPSELPPDGRPGYYNDGSGVTEDDQTIVLDYWDGEEYHPQVLSAMREKIAAAGRTFVTDDTLSSKANAGDVYAKSDLSTLTFSGEYDDDVGGTFSYDLLYVVR